MWFFCFIIHTPCFTNPFCYQTFRVIPVDRVSLEVNLKNKNNNIPHSVFYQIFLKEELPAVNMNIKTQIKIYQKLLSEFGGKFEGAEDFIKSRLMELRSEHGISAEEVRLYSLAMYTV